MCANPADGHCVTATATNMQGGKNIIQAHGYHHHVKAKNLGQGKLIVQELANKLAEQVNTYAADLASNLPPPVGPLTTISPFYAIADSGCTAHFFSSMTPVCNKRQTTTPLTIHTPLGAIIHSTHEAELDCPSLPPAVQHGHVIPQLATQPFLSIGQLCDAGCNVAFTATTVTFCHNDKVIMSGHCTAATKL